VPELLFQVAAYVPARSLATCARVCKTWHRTFIMFIWEDVKANQVGRLHSMRALWKYRRLVKNLELDNRSPEFYELIFYPNLESLMVSGGVGNVDPGAMVVAHHRFLTRLSLKNFRSSTLFPLWDKLLEFPGLKELAISDTTLSKKEVDKLWQLCQRLTRVAMDEVHIPGEGMLSSMTFPNMRKISVRHTVRVRSGLILEWLQRCPGLEQVHCELDREFEAGFIPLLAAKIWPGLHSLSLRSSTLRGTETRQIVEGMERIERLDLHGMSDQSAFFFMDQLRMHFGPGQRHHYHHLRELCVRSSRGIGSLVIQEILSSCPLLEKLWGYRIQAFDIVQGQPWVCMNLQELCVSFRFDSKTIAEEQPLVLAQVARLTRLRVLVVNDGQAKFQEAFDLRVESGLDQLCKLRSLRTLGFEGSEQRMGWEEMGWMMEHWWALQTIYGTLSGRDVHGQNKEMEKRLRRHGILVEGSKGYKHACNMPSIPSEN
ncbi:hypothetical protein BGX34_002332, partial [Mortierella sp. NVP85]